MTHSPARKTANPLLRAASTCVSLMQAVERMWRIIDTAERLIRDDYPLTPSGTTAQALDRSRFDYEVAKLRDWIRAEFGPA